MTIHISVIDFYNAIEIKPLNLRLAATGAIRRYLAVNPNEFDSRAYNRMAREAMRDICIGRFQAFGSAGHADKVQSLGLKKMVSFYL